jgi:hypothetical protein
MRRELPSPQGDNRQAPSPRRPEHALREHTEARPRRGQDLLVKAAVREATIEDDHDVHLLIASRAHHNHTMIVEFPDPRCVASSFKRDRI